MRLLRFLALVPLVLVRWALLGACCMKAYRIRLHAVNTYGYIIHEFDPWFNYRAAEYLGEHGWAKFFKWYDYMSWYPIGRPVGTTIFPGMQILSVWIWEASKTLTETKIKIPKEYRSYLPDWVLYNFPNQGKFLKFEPMSLNDVCCMVPAWFGAVATFFTYLLTVEVSESPTAGLVAAGVMAVIPAHMMRSAAGEFDNECVAVTTFCVVLWLWARCVRTSSSWPWAILAGVAYISAAWTWGGYIFINNLIGLHAFILVALGKYNSGIYKAYTLYYVIGTLGAMQCPVIGMAPLRSLEQLPSLLTFLGYQFMELCDIYRRRQKKPMSAASFCTFRLALAAGLGAGLALAGWVLMEMGVFTPLGSRIRGLFLEAMKTGNPLVDSVAEHRPSTASAYDLYLSTPRYLAALGLLFCWHQRTPGKLLAFLYAVVSYHYSLKMSRLMIICGPIVSVLAGFPVGIVIDWCLEQFVSLIGGPPEPAKELPAPVRTGGMGSLYRFFWKAVGSSIVPKEVADLAKAKGSAREHLWFLDRPLRAAVAGCILLTLYNQGVSHVKGFADHCNTKAQHMANPMLLFQTQLRTGETVIVDDYLRGYEWIKDNTPEDARVMAWWDYGYQITGVANRTSIADGNTWNHEHIATLGRMLTSPEKKAHNAIRHLADYVLVWAGGRGDDMGKSPHLARIGNSVFPDHCGDDDPLCHKFSFDRDGTPTPMMAKSLLYKAVNHNKKQGVTLNSKYWQEVHTTKYGLMRVYKVLNISETSKTWVSDPANRICDAPGSWYCIGQYPPALKPLIDKRRSFAQLEDFNKKDAGKSAYTKLIEKQRKEEAKTGKTIEL